MKRKSREKSSRKISPAVQPCLCWASGVAATTDDSTGVTNLHFLLQYQPRQVPNEGQVVTGGFADKVLGGKLGAYLSKGSQNVHKQQVYCMWFNLFEAVVHMSQSQGTTPPEYQHRVARKFSQAYQLSSIHFTARASSVLNKSLQLERFINFE